MNISPGEAGEALAAIRNVTQKTRRSIASSGVHILWMGVLVGGGMIALGLYIHLRW